jgi:hypothetical protein
MNMVDSKLKFPKELSGGEVIGAFEEVFGERMRCRSRTMRRTDPKTLQIAGVFGPDPSSRVLVRVNQGSGETPRIKLGGRYQYVIIFASEGADWPGVKEENNWDEEKAKKLLEDVLSQLVPLLSLKS